MVLKSDQSRTEKDKEVITSNKIANRMPIALAVGMESDPGI